MTIKKGNRVIGITLPEFHLKKLDVMSKRAGLGKSAIIQRLIENFKLFQEEGEKTSPSGKD